MRRKPLLNESKEKLVIYKQFGGFRVTPESNYNARIQDARKIQKIDDAESADEIIKYYIKYGWADSNDDFIVKTDINEDLDAEDVADETDNFTEEEGEIEAKNDSELDTVLDELSNYYKNIDVLDNGPDVEDRYEVSYTDRNEQEPEDASIDESLNEDEGDDRNKLLRRLLDNAKQSLELCHSNLDTPMARKLFTREEFEMLWDMLYDVVGHKKLLEDMLGGGGSGAVLTEDLFNNANGTQYEIIERGYNKAGTPCMLLKGPRGQWIAAWDVKDGDKEWGQGHYFDDEEDARNYFDANYSFPATGSRRIGESLSLNEDNFCVWGKAVDDAEVLKRKFKERTGIEEGHPIWVVMENTYDPKTRKTRKDLVDAGVKL